MKILIYGGNGFVGTNVARQLSETPVQIVCVSRSGNMPIQLKDKQWAQRIKWQTGDAAKPDPELLSSAAVVISTVGSPPIPTFSQSAYDQKVFSNGISNAHLIEAAAQAGVKRLVLLGAKIPNFLNQNWFAYSKGKTLAVEAARKFAANSAQQSAVVLQPGGIFGTRYSKGGRAIPIDLIMKPLSKILPSQLLSVEQVANCISRAALNEIANSEALTLIPHDDIRLASY